MPGLAEAALQKSEEFERSRLPTPSERRADDARVLGVVVDGGGQAEDFLGLDQGANGFLLVGADLQDQVAARLQEGHGFFDQAGDHVESAGPAVERRPGLVVADPDLEVLDLARGDVRGIREDGVERAFMGDRSEAIAQAEIDPVGDLVLIGILPGDRQRRLADVDGDEVRPGCRNVEAIARQPEPVPTSTARGDSRLLVRARNSTTTNSDSGRGISTAGETSKASE